MNLAILELTTWSEIAALVAVVTAIWGVLAALLVNWLGTKFIKKTAYYADKREADTAREALDHRIAAIEQAQALANAPMKAVQESVNEMKDQLKKLTDTIGTMKESVGNAIHDIDKRTVALEAATKGRRGGGGR